MDGRSNAVSGGGSAETVDVDVLIPSSGTTLYYNDEEGAKELQSPYTGNLSVLSGSCISCYSDSNIFNPNPSGALKYQVIRIENYSIQCAAGITAVAGLQFRISNP